VGSELTEALAAQSDIPYRIAAHTPEKVTRRFGANVPVVKFDFGDRSTWPAVLEGGKILFLLFPLPHGKTAKSRMMPFVEAAAKAGIEHIIYVSVPGAHKIKIVPHYWVEHAIRNSGVAYTILQASYFAQNFTRAISSHIVDIAMNNEIFIPAKRGTTTFLDSRDLAQAALNIVRDPAPHKNQTYVLSGPEALDHYQAATIFSEELGRPIRYSDPSMPHFLWRMMRRGVPSDVLFFMFVVYNLTRVGKNAVMTETLGKLLGHSPRTLRDFVRDNRHQWTPEFVAKLEKVVTPGFQGKNLEAKGI